MVLKTAENSTRPENKMTEIHPRQANFEWRAAKTARIYTCELDRTLASESESDSAQKLA